MLTASMLFGLAKWTGPGSDNFLAEFDFSNPFRRKFLRADSADMLTSAAVRKRRGFFPIYLFLHSLLYSSSSSDATRIHAESLF